MTKLESAGTNSQASIKNVNEESQQQLDSILSQVEDNVAALKKYSRFLESSNDEPKEMLGAHFINFHSTFSKLMASQQQLEQAYPGISDPDNHELSDKAKQVQEQLQSAVNLGLKILQEIDVSTYSLKNQMDAIKDVISND